MATTSMSSDELRAHLYRSLQGKGILDSLKSQLRNRLVTELQMSMEASSPSRQKTNPASSDVTLATGHSHTISVQVANSIVAEHLKRCGYEYSLSVFLPEGGITLEKLLSIDELLHYLRVSPSSPLHQTLKSTDGKCGFLVHLLEALIETGQLSAAPTEGTHSTGIQTDDDTSGSGEPEACLTKPSVADQLRAVDESYAQKAKEESEKSSHSIAERINLIQSELESRYKKQLESELSLYRARELAKVRLEEREKYLEEMAREKTQLNQDHQRKVEELRKSEQHIVDEYRLKEQELEGSIYSQRQSLLGEFEGIRRKEEERKRQTELSKRSIEVEEQRLKAMAEDLENQRKKLEQAAEEKAQRYRLEIESSFQTRETELKRQESELQVAHEATSTLKTTSQTLTSRLKEEREKNSRLQALLHEATNRQATLEKQKDSMAQKLKEMSDYQTLKQRSLDLHHQLTATSKKFSETKTEYKQRHSEQQKLIKSLQSRLSTPGPELVALQVEIEQLQKTHQEEVMVFECDNKELRKQLMFQADYCQELQKHMDNQMLQLRMAQREVEDLRQILEHSKPTVLQAADGGTTSAERKMRADPKRQVRTSKKGSKSHPSPHQLHQQHTTTAALPLPTHAQPTAATGPYREAHTVSFSDASAQFLAETRETFARLEKEAEELEKSYKIVRHSKSSSSLIAPLFEAMPKPQYTLANHGGLDMSPSLGLEPHNLSSISTVSTIHSTHSPLSDESEPMLSPKYRLSPPPPVTSMESVPGPLFPPPIPPVSVTSSFQPLTDPLLHVTRSSSTFHSSAPLLLPVTTTTTNPLSPLGFLAPVSSGTQTVPVSLPRPAVTSIHPAPQSQVNGTTPASIPQTVSTSVQLTTDEARDGESSSTVSESEVVPVAKKQSIVESTATTTVAATVTTTASSEPAAPQTVVSSQMASSAISVKESPKKISLDDWWKSPAQVEPAPKLHTVSSEDTKPPVDAGTGNRKDSQMINSTVAEEPPPVAPSNRPLQTTAAKTGSVECLARSANVDLRPDRKDERTKEEPHVTDEAHESQDAPSVSIAKNEDDGIDPVMLKYMEIVAQKREEEKCEQQQQQKQRPVAKDSVDKERDSPHSRDYDVPSLSQVSEGFGGLSDDGDPFEDW